MKFATRKIVKIIISIVYIIWGLFSPIAAFNAILALDLSAIIATIPSLLMLFAGILGLLSIKKLKCRIYGIILFVCALAVAIPTLLTAGLIAAISPLITALLAWLYIICV